jgi:hypothetical protein
MLGLFLTMGFSIDANAWGYKKESVECTVTNTFNYVLYEYSESYAGTKNVCRDGDAWWCRSTYCG